MELSDILLWTAILVSIFSDRIDRTVKADGKLRKVLCTVGMIAGAVYCLIHLRVLLNR